MKNLLKNGQEDKQMNGYFLLYMFKIAHGGIFLIIKNTYNIPSPGTDVMMCTRLSSMTGLWPQTVITVSFLMQVFQLLR